MMKETKGSLKAYFIAVGILGILLSIGEIYLNPDILIIIFSSIGLVISGFFIYFGFQMYDYLDNYPKKLINFVVIILGLRGALYLIAGQLIHLIVVILLGWYLIHNIKKLSKEDSSEKGNKNQKD